MTEPNRRAAFGRPPGQVNPRGPGRGRAAGFAAGLVAAVVLIPAAMAATVWIWPDHPVLRSGTRLVDNLALHLALLALPGIALLWLMRAPRGAVWLAAGLVAVAFAVVGTLTLRAGAPLAEGRAPDLRVLWFNMLIENPTDPDRLAAALEESPADVIVLSESYALAGVQDRLSRSFDIHGDCAGNGRDCRLQVLVRAGLEARVTIRNIGRLAEPRLADIRLGIGDRGLILVGTHMIKPWYTGLSEGEDHALFSTLQHRPGPLALVGDFNTAPWGQRLRRLVEDCGLRLAPLPRPTWPVGAGPLGLPIDHVLVRGGLRLTSVESWGAGLGSNHLGLLAGLVLPEPGPRAPPPEACLPV